MYLTFSDSAKFAQAAQNFLAGHGLVISHSFFDLKTISSYQPGDFFPVKFYPLTSWLLALFFRFLPVTDQTISLAGWLTFIASILLVYLIAKKLDRPASGFVAACLFLLSPPFWEYASNASSEIFFGLQILLFTYFALSRFPLLALLPFFLMFITRQQAVVIFVSCSLTSLFLLFSSNKTRRFKILTFLLLSVALFILARFSLATTQTRFSPGSLIGTINLPTNAPQGLFLRGLKYTSVTPTQLAVKTFYNFYNFVKNFSAIAPPVVFVLFLWSFFLKKVNRSYVVFNIFTALSFFLLLFSASISLPNSRYIHPIVPLIIINAAISLITLVRLAKIKRQVVVVSATLLLATLPFLGHLTLDARFRRQQFNLAKPPVYREISRVMAENIPRGKLIITNLDAWAAWYDSLTTMWFPISPDLLAGYQSKVDYIVITNYLENDSDFALGEWREVVYSPSQIKNQFLKNNYRVLKTFTINPTDVFENESFQGTILARR